MKPIIFPIGDVTLKPFVIWVMVFFGMLFFSFAQSYAQAKGWKTGKMIGLGVVFILVGDLIVFLIYKAMNLPYELNLGEVNIHAYGFMLTIALLVGLVITLRRAKQENVDSEIILDVFFAIVIGLIIGSRLLYVILKYNEFLVPVQIEGGEEQMKFVLKDSFMKIMRIWEGGLSVHGGVIGAMLAGGIYVKIKKLNYWKIADLFAPGLALGTAIGRIGCFLNGCCFGVLCKNPSAWYAVSFPHGQHTGVTTDPRHPAQLYMMLLNLVIFFILRGMYKNRKFDGHVFLLWVGLYSVARFFQEFFRFEVSSDVVFGVITVAQLASIILAILAFVIIAEVSKRIEMSKRLSDGD